MEKEKRAELVKKNIMDDLKTISILYAEDDNAIFNSLSPILQKIFKNVYWARDWVEWLNLFKDSSEDIDIVLTDISMPNMDGIKMSEEIKKIDEDIELIACTAHSETSNLLKFIDLWFSSVAIKPISLPKLVWENLKKSVRNILLRRERDSLLLKLQEELLNVSSLNLKLKEEHEEYVKLQESSQVDHHEVFVAIQKEHEILKSERKRAERLLEIVDIIALRTRTDLKWNITFANNKFCEVTGYHDSEIIWKPHNIVRHEDVSSEVYEEMWEIIKSWHSFRREWLKNKWKDWKEYYVDTRIFPTVDHKWNIDWYEAIRFDVTQSILKWESFDKARDLILKTKRESADQKRLQDEYSKTNREKLNSALDLLLNSTNFTEKELSFYRDKTVDNQQKLIKRISVLASSRERDAEQLKKDFNDKIKRETGKIATQRDQAIKEKKELEDKMSELYWKDWTMDSIREDLGLKRENYYLMEKNKTKDNYISRLEKDNIKLKKERDLAVENMNKAVFELREKEKSNDLFERKMYWDLTMKKKEVDNALREIDKLREENKTLKEKKSWIWWIFWWGGK